MCDGPPSIMRKMQFFALAEMCGGLAASGPAPAADVAPARASLDSSEVSATPPILAPRLYKNSRRVGAHNARCPAHGNGCFIGNGLAFISGFPCSNPTQYT